MKTLKTILSGTLLSVVVLLGAAAPANALTVYQDRCYTSTDAWGGKTKYCYHDYNWAEEFFGRKVDGHYPVWGSNVGNIPSP